MATAATIVNTVCLALCFSIPRYAVACRFAELTSDQKSYGGHSRMLLADVPFNDTNKDEAIAASDERAKATAESIMDYIKKATPTTIQDLLTPVGNYTDATVYWDAKTEYSRYIPGAIKYSVKSIPDLIRQMEEMAQTKIGNEIASANLDPTYAMIFSVLNKAINPTITGLALRLAFHDAGTWNAKTRPVGGANGSIRFEFAWPSNAGLQRFIWPTIWAAKQVLDRTLPNPVSYADLCAIAGAVGVYATKGPLINVGYGRPDATSPDPFQGVGSNTNQQRDYPIQEIINEWEFYGFTMEDLVVLSGGHTIGFSASTNPQGTINAEDRYFSNKYYKQVILGDAFFGSDKALKDSNATYAIVKQLAADNDLFYRKFTAAMQKLTWLGVDPSVKRLGL